MDGNTDTEIDDSVDLGTSSTSHIPPISFAFARQSLPTFSPPPSPTSTCGSLRLHHIYQPIHPFIMNKDGISKLLVLPVVTLSVAGAVAAAVHYQRQRKQQQQQRQEKPMRDLRLMPGLVLAESGRVVELERFSHYVARQFGFEDMEECPQLIKIANDYLRNEKGREAEIYDLFANDPNADSLCVNLIEELDKCIFGYFSFHWAHASLMVSQVLTVEGEKKKRLKNMIMEATRKQRFEMVMKNLKVTNVFSTLVEELKAIGGDVMVPAAHCDRRPVLLLMGGGMGAGKSTILKEILKEAFWSLAADNAVVVEADAFKETDVIYRAISSRGHHNDMLQTAELVHQSSTDAASSLLVTALNEGRDVIMDGTLSWEPFVEQTIAMARNVHQQRYRMGVGYKVAEDGTIAENYWEPVEKNEGENEIKPRKPYRIELVGVICDAYVAVIRGIRRAIMTGRAVRVKSQLKSHQRFAEAFSRYCELVDNARLYCTNPMGPTKLIAWKDGNSSLLVAPKEISTLEKVIKLNENANSIYEVYPQTDTTCESDSVWNDMLMSPQRILVQQELKEAIKKHEGKV